VTTPAERATPQAMASYGILKDPSSSDRNDEKKSSMADMSGFLPLDAAGILQLKVRAPTHNSVNVPNRAQQRGDGRPGPAAAMAAREERFWAMRVQAHSCATTGTTWKPSSAPRVAQTTPASVRFG